MAKKALGNGLDTMLGVNTTQTRKTKQSGKVETKEIIKEVVKEVVKEVPTEMTLKIKDIEINKEQPRKLFNEDALQELADSISQHGIIEPLVVTKRDKYYLLVSGERRWRAAMKAGLKEVPVVVKDYTDQEILEIGIIENIQREDLNPIETARAMRDLINNYGWTQEVLADRLGKSRPVVANFIRLLNLCPEVIEMIESGKLSAGHARSLVVVTDPAVQLKLAKEAVTKKVTVRDLEKAVKELQNPKAKKQKAEISMELKDLIHTMQHKFSTKVNVLGNNKRGRIYIDYYNADDLDRIYDLINRL